MVVLNRIYTRTGDDGTTSLGSGERRKKYDLRVAAYGTVDEANAVIGLVRLHTAGDAALDNALGRIQNDLFDVEADLCLAEKGPGGARLTVKPAGVPSMDALYQDFPNFTEVLDDIKRQLQEAAKFVPLEQLAISPQCGFASTEEGNILSEDEQWAKLRFAVEIAEEVWGK